MNLTANERGIAGSSEFPTFASRESRRETHFPTVFFRASFSELWLNRCSIIPYISLIAFSGSTLSLPDCMESNVLYRLFTFISGRGR